MNDETKRFSKKDVDAMVNDALRRTSEKLYAEFASIDARADHLLHVKAKVDLLDTFEQCIKQDLNIWDEVISDDGRTGSE